MNTCPSCGHQINNNAPTCANCGQFYSKIIELIEQEVAKEARQSLRGRLQYIVQAENKSQALQHEWQDITAPLSKMAWFALGTIAFFLFALIIIVL